MWFCTKDTKKNLGQPLGHSAGQLRQLCLESLENRMALAVDPLAAIDAVSAPRLNQRAEFSADTASESTDSLNSLSPSSSHAINALGQLFLTSRLEITDAQGRAVTSVQENERLWVNVYNTYFRDSFTEDFKLVAATTTVVFDDPLFTQVGEVESLDMPAETAWQRRTIPDPRTGIGTLSGIEVLQHRFEVLAAPSNGPHGSELHKTLQRPGGYLWIESLPLTIEQEELAPPVVVPDNTPVVTPTVTPIVTPTVTPVVAPTATLTPLPQVPASDSLREPTAQAATTETGDTETNAMVSSKPSVAEHVVAKEAVARETVAEPAVTEDSSVLSMEDNEAPSFTKFASVLSGVETAEFRSAFTFPSATQGAKIDFSHRLDARDLLDAIGRLDDEAPSEARDLPLSEEAADDLATDLPASEPDQLSNLPEPAPPGVIDRLLQDYLEEHPEPPPERGRVDWEVRYRGEQLWLLQLDDQAEAGNAFVNLDYSQLPYELDRSIGLQSLAETDADIHQQGLVQFQRGPLQMLRDIDLYQQQPPRDVVDLALPEAEPETLKSAGNYPSLLRETAIALLAILLPARRRVRIGTKNAAS